MRAIDADALKELIATNVYPVRDDFANCDYGMFWTGGIEKAIDEMPTVEPERKMDEWCTDCKEYDQEKYCCPRFNRVIRETVKEIQQSWTPCSEELPKDTDPVNITWVNHKPEPYYASIKDKPFTATGCYCDGKWYWYSVTCQDYLDEYRYCDVDSMDENIEVIAWKPLPLPYQGEEK